MRDVRFGRYKPKKTTNFSDRRRREESVSPAATWRVMLNREVPRFNVTRQVAARATLSSSILNCSESTDTLQPVWLSGCYSAPLGSGVLRSVCLYVCECVCPRAQGLSLEPLARSPRTLLCRSPVTAVGSSSGGDAIRYVLPVFWMTSYWP